MSAINQLAGKLAEVKKEVISNAKTAIKEALDVFFVDNPSVVGIRWNQYIPGFNDGDPCEFTFGSTYIKTQTTPFTEEEQEKWGDGYGCKDGFINLKECQDWKTKEWAPGLNETLYTQANELFTAIHSLGDVLGTVFEQNAEVTVLRDSTEFDIEEYDCGF